MVAKKVKKARKSQSAVKKKSNAKKAVTKGTAMKKATAKKAKTKKTVSKKAVKKSSPKKTVKRATAKKAVKKTSKKAASKATKKVTKKATTKKTKKVAAKKSNPIKKKMRKKKKSPLSKTDIKKFTAILFEKLKELTGDVNHIEKGALRTSRLDAAGDLSSMPIHMADMGTDNFEQEFALGLMDGERKLLREIYAALERINEGTYGICEGTDKPIQKARLEASPWSRYCIEYATMVEKGLVIEGEKVYDDEDEFDDEPDADAAADDLDDEYVNFASTGEDDF